MTTALLAHPRHLLSTSSGMIDLDCQGCLMELARYEVWWQREVSIEQVTRILSETGTQACWYWSQEDSQSLGFDPVQRILITIRDVRSFNARSSPQAKLHCHHWRESWEVRWHLIVCCWCHKTRLAPKESTSRQVLEDGLEPVWDQALLFCLLDQR